MTSKNDSKTGSAAEIVVKPQKGTTLKVMPAPNVLGKPFCVLSHQSGNLLTTPRTSAWKFKTLTLCISTLFPIFCRYIYNLIVSSILTLFRWYVVISEIYEIQSVTFIFSVKLSGCLFQICIEAVFLNIFPSHEPQSEI